MVRVLLDAPGPDRFRLEQHAVCVDVYRARLSHHVF